MDRKPPAGTSASLPRGITIRRRADGDRIQIAFSYRGEQCRELLGPAKITKARIEYAAGLRNEIRRRIADGTFDYAAYFPNSPRAKKPQDPRLLVTLGALLRRQRAIYENMGRNRTLSPSTVLGYIKAIDQRLLPRWDAVEIGALTSSDLRNWIGGLETTGKTIRNTLTPLRSVLDDAITDELITSNPLDRVALKKLIKQTARKSTYEVDPFTADERAALVSSARPDEMPLIKFWFETGLRHGEIIALTWDDIDWNAAVARISRNVVGGWADGKRTQVEKAPKSDAGNRKVELSVAALSALDLQKPFTYAPGGRVWRNPRTGRGWETETQIRKSLWIPLCERAGVRYRNPYQIRHTFASSRLTDGANPYWMADQLGHENLQLVFRVYGKFIPQDFKGHKGFTPVSHEAETADPTAEPTD